MNNFEKAYEGLSSLSLKGKASLNELIKYNVEKYQGDFVGAMLESLTNVQNAYTDERCKDFEDKLKTISKNDFLSRYNIDTSLFTNLDFITWLVNFTKKHEYIESNWSEYRFDSLTDIDRNNLTNNIELFFRGIEDYARKNQIEPCVSGDDFVGYIVRYNDVFLHLDVYVHGGGFSCSINNTSNIKAFIDFNDLMKYYQYKDSEKPYQRSR